MSEPVRDPAQFPTIVRSFGFSPLAGAIWRDDAQAPGLQWRNLSLGPASDAQLAARHLRGGGEPVTTGTLADPQSPLAFLFVLHGSLTLRPAQGDPVELGAYDAACGIL